MALLRVCERYHFLAASGTLGARQSGSRRRRRTSWPAVSLALAFTPTAAANCEAYALNEVAVNWNAPLVWVAAYLNDPW